MNKLSKQKWLDALRSGKYKQGKDNLRNTLNNETEFCCIGVWADITDSKGWNDEGWGDTKNDEFPDHLITSLTKNGFTYSDAMEYLNNLANKNDAGVNFNAIADMIEKDIVTND